MPQQQSKQQQQQPPKRQIIRSMSDDHDLLPQQQQQQQQQHKRTRSRGGGEVGGSILSSGTSTTSNDMTGAQTFSSRRAGPSRSRSSDAMPSMGSSDRDTRRRPTSNGPAKRRVASNTNTETVPHPYHPQPQPPQQQLKQQQQQLKQQSSGAATASSADFVAQALLKAFQQQQQQQERQQQQQPSLNHNNVNRNHNTNNLYNNHHDDETSMHSAELKRFGTNPLLMGSSLSSISKVGSMSAGSSLMKTGQSSFPGGYAAGAGGASLFSRVGQMSNTSFRSDVSAGVAAAQAVLTTPNKTKFDIDAPRLPLVQQQRKFATTGTTTDGSSSNNNINSHKNNNNNHNSNNLLHHAKSSHSQDSGTVTDEQRAWKGIDDVLMDGNESIATRDVLPEEIVRAMSSAAASDAKIMNRTASSRCRAHHSRAHGLDYFSEEQDEQQSSAAENSFNDNSNYNSNDHLHNSGSLEDLCNNTLSSNSSKNTVATMLPNLLNSSFSSVQTELTRQSLVSYIASAADEMEVNAMATFLGAIAQSVKEEKQKKANIMAGGAVIQKSNSDHGCSGTRRHHLGHNGTTTPGSEFLRMPVKEENDDDDDEGEGDISFHQHDPDVSESTERSGSHHHELSHSQQQQQHLAEDNDGSASHLPELMSSSFSSLKSELTTATQNYVVNNKKVITDLASSDDNDAAAAANPTTATSLVQPDPFISFLQSVLLTSKNLDPVKENENNNNNPAETLFSDAATPLEVSNEKAFAAASSHQQQQQPPANPADILFGDFEGSNHPSNSSHHKNHTNCLFGDPPSVVSNPYAANNCTAAADMFFSGAAPQAAEVPNEKASTKPRSNPADCLFDDPSIPPSVVSNPVFDDDDSDESAGPPSVVSNPICNDDDERLAPSVVSNPRCDEDDDMLDTPSVFSNPIEDHAPDENDGIPFGVSNSQEWDAVGDDDENNNGDEDDVGPPYVVSNPQQEEYDEKVESDNEEGGPLTAVSNPPEEEEEEEEEEGEYDDGYDEKEEYEQNEVNGAAYPTQESFFATPAFTSNQPSVSQSAHNCAPKKSKFETRRASAPMVSNVSSTFGSFFDQPSFISAPPPPIGSAPQTKKKQQASPALSRGKVPKKKAPPKKAAGTTAPAQSFGAPAPAPSFEAPAPAPSFESYDSNVIGSITQHSSHEDRKTTVSGAQKKVPKQQGVATGTQKKAKQNNPSVGNANRVVEKKVAQTPAEQQQQSPMQGVPRRSSTGGIAGAFTGMRRRMSTSDAEHVKAREWAVFGGGGDANANSNGEVKKTRLVRKVRKVKKIKKKAAKEDTEKSEENLPTSPEGFIDYFNTAKEKTMIYMSPLRNRKPAIDFGLAARTLPANNKKKKEQKYVKGEGANAFKSLKNKMMALNMFGKGRRGSPASVCELAGEGRGEAQFFPDMDDEEDDWGTLLSS